MSTQDPIERISEAFAELASQNERLEESLSQVRMILDTEDRGWSLLSKIANGDDLEGFSLEEAQEVSKKIRPFVSGASLVSRAAALHSGYVWSKEMNIEGVKRTGKKGSPTKLMRFYNDPVNQEHLFSALAHEELQKGRFADGNILIGADTRDQTARVLPFNQITNLRVNPDHPSEVWMYQRTWNPQIDGSSEPRVEWYYTNRYKGAKQNTVTDGNERQPVNPYVTIIDRKFNRLPGYVLGVPDAVAGMPWSAAYEEILQYGRVVDRSLSALLYKITNKTKAGTQASAVKIAGMSGTGNAASMVEGQDIQALSTAGKGYDFSNPRPVAAMAAAAWNVSNMDLLNDSSAAGSSYGSANALVPANKNAMRLIQAEWVSLFEEILTFFGLGSPRVWFEELDEVDPYREMQALKLGQDALHPEEYRGKVLDYQDIPGDPSDIPDSLLNPEVTDTSNANAGVQAASPDQGVSNGTGTSQSGGGGQGANDLRSDLVNESLRREMAMTELVERFEAVAARLDAQSN